MSSDSPFQAPPTLALLMDGVDAKEPDARILPVRLVETDEVLPNADFRVMGRIGQGGMGRVDEAEQLALGRSVAIKRATTGDPRQTRRLLKEAWLNGQLEHPNIPPVHLVGETEDGSPVVVMKRVEGEPWSDLMSSETLERNLDIFEAICHAVAYAHDREIVHRDLKPGNVIVGDHGAVWLLDWGIAALVGEQTHGTGTPQYMAPEMCEPGSAIRASDVFLLGAVLHEILTGAAPHRGTTSEEILDAARRALPPSFDASVPPGLAAICTRAMSVDPADRYQTATDLQRAIRAWREARVRDEIEAEARRSAEQFLERARAAAASPDDLDLEATARSTYAIGRYLLDRATAHGADVQAWVDRCRAAMVEIELQAGGIGAAKALAAEDGAAPELTARIDEEARRQAEREAENRRLVAAAERLDSRNYPFLGFALIIPTAAAVVLVAMWLQSIGVVSGNIRPLLVGVACHPLILGLRVLAVQRRARLATTITTAMVIWWTAVVVLRAIALLVYGNSSTHIPELFAAGGMLLGMFTVNWRIPLATIPYIPGVVGILMWPEYEAVFYTGSVLAAGAIVLWVIWTDSE